MMGTFDPARVIPLIAAFVPLFTVAITYLLYRGHERRKVDVVEEDQELKTLKAAWEELRLTKKDLAEEREENGRVWELVGALRRENAELRHKIQQCGGTCGTLQ